MDAVIIVLALQNIENLNGVMAECSRVLCPGGRLFLVLNHPAFRIPKKSSWGFDPVTIRLADSPSEVHSVDEKKQIQFRRLDEYISESRAEIQMQPGKVSSAATVSFHRPLQTYFKSFQKNGFAVTRLEEWVSPKKSDPGPRAVAENKARKEFPLFLFVQAEKLQ